MESYNKPIRWVYLVLGTAALLFAGVIYAWSILKAPLATEFGWAASALSLNFTITMCCFCLGGMLGGVAMKKVGFTVTCIAAAVLAAAGFAGTSLNEGAIGLLYVCYGVMSGLGIGMAYNALISTVNAWFPDKKGLCSGVLMMGFGASALVLGSAADSLITNPAFGWRVAFRILGIALAVVVAIAGLIIKKPEAAAAPVKEGAADDDAAGSQNDFTPAQMLRTSMFWKAFVVIVCLSAVGNTVISMAKDLALSAGAEVALATTLVGVLSVCNGLGRVITGAFFDRFGRRTTMIAANVVAICAAGITLVSLLTSSLPLCIAGLCLTGISYGTCPTIGSAFVSEVFGPTHFSSNFPLMNFNLMFASFIATGASLIIAATGTIASAFVLLVVLSVAALLLNLSLKK